MFHRDDTGIAVAAAAVLLAAGVFALDGLMGPAAGVSDAAGLERASGQALELEGVGSPVVWRDQAAGVTAVITPARAFRDAEGRWCRGYELELAADGRAPLSPSHHVACRDDAGAWRAPTRAQGKGTATAFDRWLDRLTGGTGEQLAGTGG